MLYVPIDTVETGQQLDADVHDINGRLLLSKDRLLSLNI
jgi:hypothetical protein